MFISHCHIFSISFLNLNSKSFREIRQEFTKFGEIVRQTTGGGSNTDELVTISYNDKGGAVRALQTHFTNKDYPYLDIAKGETPRTCIRRLTDGLSVSGSSLLLVNSSDSSDCEDHETSILAAVRAGALHPHHHDLLQEPLSARHDERHVLQHDPFSRAPAPPGSDVVDELLKPLQSYFSVFRTGQYTGGTLDDLVNGGPPAHNTRSQSDKRYKIKKQDGERNRKRGERSEMTENGHLAHHPPMGMVNIPMGAPPPITNGFGPHNQRMETEIVHLQSPPNMAEPPPNMVTGPPPHYLLMPPPVLLSSSPTSASSNTANKEEEETEPSKEQQLELDIGKMSISESEPVPAQDAEDVSLSEESPLDLQQLSQLLTKDLFNLYSLSFICKSKELSERRIRLDFGLVAEVTKYSLREEQSLNISLFRLLGSVVKLEE